MKADYETSLLLHLTFSADGKCNYRTQIRCSVLLFQNDYATIEHRFLVFCFVVSVWKMELQNTESVFCCILFYMPNGTRTRIHCSDLLFQKGKWNYRTQNRCSVLLFQNDYGTTEHSSVFCCIVLDE